MSRKLLLTAFFSALTVSLGFLLSAVPNIELMSFTVFLSGIFIGVLGGVSVGVLSVTVYSLFNPFGAPMPQLLVAQILGFAFTGFSGAVLAPVIEGKSRRLSILISAAAGFVVTIVYDLLTTIATTLVASGLEGFADAFGGVLISGSLFVAVHAASNVAVFASSTRPVIEAKRAWERGRMG